MTFPNSYNGVKNLFTAEILKIIGGVCLVLTFVVAIIGFATAANSDVTGAAISGVSSIVLLIAAGVLPVIGYIMSLVGLRQASQDEECFKMALYFAFLALAVSIVAAILSVLNAGGGISDDIATLIRTIAEIFVFFFSIQGIINLASRLKDEKVITMGSRLLTIVTVMYALVAVVRLIGIFIQRGDEVMGVSALVMVIAAGVLAIITYIIYVVLLGKAKNMLKNN